MNALSGKIVKIASSGEIGQVHIDVNGAIFTSILLDVNSFGITIEDNVKLLFKANEVLIATKESLVSAKNAFFWASSVAEFLPLPYPTDLSEIIP